MVQEAAKAEVGTCVLNYLWVKAVDEGRQRDLLPQQARRFKEITKVQDYKANAETCGLRQHTGAGSFYTHIWGLYT